MKTFVKRTITAVAYATVGLSVCAIAFSFWLHTHASYSDQIAAYKLDLEMFKTIVAGFLVAMLGFLIPAYITEANQDFERFKESRAVYSKAKTGIDYLALRLSAATLKEGYDMIQKVHYYKHQAVLYPELEQHLKDRYDGQVSKDQWDDIIYMKLRNTRLLLKTSANIWNDLTAAERMEILREALPDIDEIDHPAGLLNYKLRLQDPYRLEDSED